MPDFIQIEGLLFVVIGVVLLAVKIYALVTALMFTPDHYRAADKLTKPAWVAILGLGAAAQMLMPDVRSLINLAFTIAVFVYLVDVRPALRSLHQR